MKAREELGKTKKNRSAQLIVQNGLTWERHDDLGEADVVRGGGMHDCWTAGMELARCRADRKRPASDSRNANRQRG